MLGTTLGAQEIFVIFLLALLLFGPKKLPEIGRTVGKAIIEFRRATKELQSTLDREMESIEEQVRQNETLDFSNDRNTLTSESVFPALPPAVAPESATPNDPATQAAQRALPEVSGLGAGED